MVLAAVMVGGEGARRGGGRGCRVILGLPTVLLTEQKALLHDKWWLSGS